MKKLIENTNTDKDKEAIIQKFKDLYHAVELDSPNRAQVEELKQFIEENPSIFLETCNLANIIIDDLLTRSKIKPTLRITIQKKTEEMKNQLNYSNSTFIEKMVIDSIIVSWARKQLLEFLSNSALVDNKIDIKYQKQWDHLLNSAHKRHSHAIDSLMRIRKTIINLQMDIASNRRQRKVQQKVK